jgi:hypothetical protein
MEGSLRAAFFVALNQNRDWWVTWGGAGNSNE